MMPIIFPTSDQLKQDGCKLFVLLTFHINSMPIWCLGNLASREAAIDYQSINQCLFSIQTNNDNIHTFVNMNTERAGKKVLLLIVVSSQIKWLVYFKKTNHIAINPKYTNKSSKRGKHFLFTHIDNFYFF